MAEKSPWVLLVRSSSTTKTKHAYQRQLLVFDLRAYLSLWLNAQYLWTNRKQFYFNMHSTYPSPLPCSFFFSNALVCRVCRYPETGTACHSEDMFVSNALELPWSVFSCWMYDDPLGFAVPQGSKYKANTLLHLSTGLWNQAKPTARDDYGGFLVTLDSSVGICT